MTETTPSPLGNVITIDDERIKSRSVETLGRNQSALLVRDAPLFVE